MIRILRCRSFAATALVATILLLSGEASAWQLDVTKEFRTWTDSTGKFKVEAKLITVVDDEASLEKQDGLVVKLPLDKLSRVDQLFVKAWKLRRERESKDAENPFAGGVPKEPENPFAGGTLSTPAKPTAKKTPAAATAQPTPPAAPTPSRPTASPIKVDFLANGKQFSPVDWQVESKPSSRQVSIAPNLTMEYPASIEHAFHDRQLSPLVSYDGEFAAVISTNPFDDDTKVAIFNLETGEQVCSAVLPIEDLKFFGIDPIRKEVLTFREGRGRASGKVEFRSFDRLDVVAKSWDTGSSYTIEGFRPEFGLLVDENRLLTVGKRLILWNLGENEPIYSVKLSPQTHSRDSFAISHDGGIAAIADFSGIQMVDLATGNALGKIAQRGFFRELCFSPSGSHLAYFNGKAQIEIWDLERNQLDRAISTTANSSLHWVDDRFLLANNKFLFDAEFRVCVWEYTPPNSNSLTALDGRNFLLRDQKQIVPVSLPHRDLTSELDQLDQLDPVELLILKPGDEVSLDFELPFDKATQIRIRDRLVKLLGEAGVTINPKSNFVLKGRVQTLKETTTQVSNTRGLRAFGRGQGELVTYTPNRSTLELIKDDKTVWRQSHYHGPRGIVRLEAEVSNQDFVDRISKPSATLFLGFRLPTDRTLLPDGKQPGKSSLRSASFIEQ